MTGAGCEAAISLARAEAIVAAKVRPGVRSHGGDVRVAEVSPEGDVTLEFSGACRACPLQPVTFGSAALPAFDGVIGVRSVRCETVRASSYAMRRLAAMFAAVNRGLP